MAGLICGGFAEFCLKNVQPELGIETYVARGGWGESYILAIFMIYR